MIKILLGGSPCTYWSIAQKNNRETEPSGIGWELFENYLIAKEKFKPDFFLYENNKSAAQAIKDEIKKRLNAWDGTLFMSDSGARYIEINSALVSAQNRQRFYVHNCGEVEQPKDRGILLKDILESGQGWTDKSYAMTASYDGAVAWNTLERHQRTMVAEPVIFQLPHGYNNGGCKYDKSPTLTANAAWQENNKVVEPVRVGDLPNASGEISGSQATRIYSIDGKSVNLVANGGGLGEKTGLYACPINITKEGKSQTIKAQYDKTSIANICCYSSTYGASGVAIPTEEKPVPFFGNGKDKESMRRVYEARNGQITIKGKQYPIKLADGFYIIRKLTVTECCRLQTMPDFYMAARIEKVKEIVFKCKDVPTQIVTIPLRTEKQGCAINTTFDLKEMEVQSLKDQKLTPHCLALSRDVIDIDKHIWDIVLCIIKDLQEKGQHDYLEAIMNMCKATMSADLSIEKLPKECWDENLKREKSSTILTLIQKIIAKITSMFVPQKNTRVYIENCAENCLSTSPTSLTVGTLYSMEKNMRLVSENACYKGLGNGWTAEVIIHILSNALKDIPKDEKIVVLSMYDGIGTGRYVLDKMGFTNVEYHAYEIDKYAMQIAMSNYPDIMQHGDAYQVREKDWKI